MAKDGQQERTRAFWFMDAQRKEGMKKGNKTRAERHLWMTLAEAVLVAWWD